MNIVKKKKILFVITKSNYGGAQRYVFDLASHLPRDRFDVAVALGGTGLRNEAPGTLQKKLEGCGIRTIVVQHFMKDMSLRNDIATFFELMRVVKKEKPDVLHVTSSKAGGIGALIGRLLGVERTIFTSHGLAFDELWRPAPERLLIKIATWTTMMLAKKTIQITEDTYKRASSMFGLTGKVVFIHNGINAPLFASKEEAREVLYPSLAHQQSLWIGTLAELTKNKNLTVLIEAVALLHEKGLRPHLFVCGEGEERETLTTLSETLGISEYVHLLGYVPEASRYLTAFDVFALPSLKEGLPYVLLEAGHASLPVVASEIPGISDILTHEHSGLMVPSHKDAFAEALYTLLTEEKVRASYSTALNTHVRKTFSVKKMVEATTLLY